MSIRQFIFLSILFSAQAFSIEVTKNCTAVLKNDKSYLSCDDGTEGYLNDSELINQAVIAYKENGISQTLTLDLLKYSDITNSENLSNIFKSKNIINVSNPRLETINVNDDIPLFKDPNRLSLSSGCNFNDPPIVFSCSELKTCNTNICFGSATCISSNKESLKDVTCNANFINGKAVCPSAVECAADSGIKISKPLQSEPQNNNTENDSTKGSSR